MSFFRDFPRSFWVSNFMELFERMAFYGMHSVLAIYLTGAAAQGCLGFPKDGAGIIMSVYTLFLWILPVFGGAFAERYGYRKTFIISLLFLSTGYFLMSQTKASFTVLGALLLVSIGGGLFKPTLTGTISRTTHAKTAAMGFGIYYMIVNIGAFIGPYVSSYFRATDWKMVFIASASCVFVMLFLAVALYREPREAGEGRASTGLGKVIADSLQVVTNWRFMALLLIYSGFWLIFWQLFFTMTLYLRDYVNTVPILEFLRNVTAHIYGPWAAFFNERMAQVAAGAVKVGEAVPPELFTSIEAVSIMIFQLAVSRIWSGFRPFTAMIAGILITTVSMFIPAFTANPWLIVVSIVLLAIGEMSVSPKFMEYVGSIAPRNQVALFLGYGFVPIGIGSFLANLLGGFLTKAAEQHAISTTAMWSVFGGIGLVTVCLMILYNRFLAPGLVASESPAAGGGSSS